MLSHADHSRLAKTIRLFDSPVAGERNAAVEAACRQIEALGLCWADIAAKLGDVNSDRKGRAALDKDLRVNPCHWDDCSSAALAGSGFCEAHIAKIVCEPLDNFVPFLKSLPNILGTKTLAKALYYAVHTAVHIGVFNRHLGHDLMRSANGALNGKEVQAIIEKLAGATSPREQGEFMMQLKRQLVVPDRRSTRREPG